MAGARTTGPARGRGGSGLADIILQSGEASARRTERFGATIGGALSDLGSTLLAKKERAAQRAERTEERTYQRGRDSIGDARYAENRDYQSGRDLLHDDRQALQDQLGAANAMRDDARADDSLAFQMEQARSQADRQAEDGKVSLLNMLADNYRMQANEAAAAGDQEGAQAALQNAMRAQKGMEAVAARRGIGLGPVAEPQAGAAGSAKPGAAPSDSEVMVPEGLDSVAYFKEIDDDYNRKVAALDKIKDPAERERQRRTLLRSRTIHTAQAKGLAVAEAERKQHEARSMRLSQVEAVLPQLPQGRREEARRRIMAGTGDPTTDANSILTSIRADEDAKQKDRPKDASPGEAVKSVAKMIDEKLDADTKIDDLTDRTEKERGYQANHGRLIERLRGQPEAMAQAFPAMGAPGAAENPAQDVMLEAVGGDPIAAARSLWDVWQRLNVNAPPAERRRVAAIFANAGEARKAKAGR